MLELSEILKFLFGVALAAWTWQLHSLNANVKELAADLRKLASRLEELATRVTVIEVRQQAHERDDLR